MQVRSRQASSLCRPRGVIFQGPFRHAQPLRLTTLLTVEHIYIPLAVRLVRILAARPEVGVWESDFLLAETSGAPVHKRKVAQVRLHSPATERLAVNLASPAMLSHHRPAPLAAATFARLV